MLTEKTVYSGFLLVKNYWDIWLIENHQLNDNNAEIIFMVMLWSNHYYLLWIYINSPSESQYYFFKQPVNPCKHCKKFPRDTSLQPTKQFQRVTHLLYSLIILKDIYREFNIRKWNWLETLESIHNPNETLSKILQKWQLSRGECLTAKN